MANENNVIRNKSCAGFCLLLMLLACPSLAQYLNEKEIEPLIHEWNFAHNTKSIESFNKIYSSQLLFYTERIGKEKAVELKQNLFQKRPGFEQKIVSEILYTAFTSGVIKCDFTKEVLENFIWKSYPSYLLVSYEGNRYWIVGESDYKTDKVLRYQLDLGDTLELEQSINNEDLSDRAEQKDSTTTSNSEYPTEEVGSDTSLDIGSVENGIANATETVSVPRLYIYILILFLMIALIISFVISAARRKRVKEETIEDNSRQSDDNFDPPIAHSAFQDFVLTLFDSLYFSFDRMRNKVAPGSNDFLAENVVDFEMHFRNKETVAHFAVKCVYIASVLTFRIFSEEDVRNFRLFEIASGLELYCIVGLAGKPDDPKHLFLIPVREMRDIVTKDDLEPYKKFGMFFFHDSLKTLR